MRHYLTTLRWYEDRLCSLSSRWLIALSFACTTGLAALGYALYQFLDDMVFLLGDSDIKIALTVLGFLLLTSASMWILSFCVGALGRRVMLYLKGL